MISDSMCVQFETFCYTDSYDYNFMTLFVAYTRWNQDRSSIIRHNSLVRNTQTPWLAVLNDRYIVIPSFVICLVQYHILYISSLCGSVSGL